MWEIEPQPFCMQRGRSTTELHPLFKFSIAPVDICNSFCYDYFVVKKVGGVGYGTPDLSHAKRTLYH